MSSVFYTADGRKMNMERFADANATPSLEDSLRLRGNLSLDGTIRAGKFLMADGSEMKTVIQEQKVSAMPETITFDAQGNMTVGSKVNGNKLLFSTKWSGFPDDKPNGAEISNDTDAFKQLMIVGNKSAGGVRTVGTWDKLVVHGELNVPEGGNEIIQNPNGQLRVNKQGIMFGGPNDKREVNSAQITAGLHIPDSLNIVGMSKDGGADSRKVDMWAEGGFNVYGPATVNGELKSDVIRPKGNRLHIAGDELLYLLNKSGVIIGKEWGGNGNLSVQGDAAINGNASVGKMTLGSLSLTDNNGQLRVTKGDQNLDIDPSKPLSSGSASGKTFFYVERYNINGTTLEKKVAFGREILENRIDVLNKAGISGDNFIVRFYFRIKPKTSPAKEIAMNITTDDGNRVYFYPAGLMHSNGTVAYTSNQGNNGWKDQGPTTYDHRFTPEGDLVHLVCIEMYERGGGEAFIIENLKNTLDNYDLLPL